MGLTTQVGLLCLIQAYRDTRSAWDTGISLTDHKFGRVYGFCSLELLPGNKL